jgi:fatty acid hydroxylase domain-containing protein 2
MLHMFLKLVFIYFSAYMIPYWIMSLFYFVIDFIAEKYPTVKFFKTQPKNKINFSEYYETVIKVLKNQIRTIPFLLIVGLLITYVGNDMDFFAIPSIYTMLTNMFTAVCFFDVIFYIFHYIGHTKYFYAKFHKIHHEWTAPVAASANYNHFLDHLIMNIMLPCISIIITKANFTTIWISMLISTLIVTSTHSGYWLALARKHDNHHRYFNCEYGVFVIDYIMGTSRWK